MNKNIQEMYNKVNSLVEKIDDEGLTHLSRFLGDRIYNLDTYVIMLGETSSGKSTIINGLMQENNLFISAAPSTGTITEVEFKNNILQKEFYAINKDATIEKIDKEIFDELIKKPDEDLKRLKLVTKSPDYKFSNMRLFDTPGYGSIIKEHEEVLKDFIPNSDSVIYTVNYKIGIQNNDYGFLSFLRELIRDDVEIILVINRCPKRVKDLEIDKRVVEIKKIIKDILHQETYTVLVRAETCEDEYPLPKCEGLWNYIEKNLNSPKRINMIENICTQYIFELLYMCEEEIEKRYQNIKLSKDIKEKIKGSLEAFIEKTETIVPEMIEPTFDKLIDSLDDKFNTAKKNIKKNTSQSIENIDNIRKEETIAYISNHLLPYSTEIEVNEIKRYIEITLEDLNNKINDYLNSEIIKFNKDIEIYFSSTIELAGKQLGKNIGKNFVDVGLKGYFAKFGGQGGAGAGIANAASHYLKVVGDIFNKKFSLATHNALKSGLKKMGATSLKFISNVAIVFVELVTLTIDYSTWKGKLIGKIDVAVDDWSNQSLDAIKKDLLKLKDENIDILRNIVDEQRNKFDYSEEIPDEKETIELIDTLEKIKSELGVS